MFIHGIGIGLYPYVNFLTQLDSRLNYGRGSEDQVGIIAIEIMPVSFRITHSAMTKDEMCGEIEAIVKHHGFDKPVFVAHSYGTVITTQLLKSPKFVDQIGSIVLIDPISILLHLPDVAYNFTRKKPKRANEYQLHYFASMDMGVSHSLSRCFFWSENVLWKHDIGDRAITVSLAERDLIVNTKAVGSYLATHNGEAMPTITDFAKLPANGSILKNVVSEHESESASLSHRPNGHIRVSAHGDLHSKTTGDLPHTRHRSLSTGWTDRTWLGRGVDLVWFRNLDHAQVFDKPHTRKPLVDAIYEYSIRLC